MKKVLSVTMASAMVLGMGANAFAVKYDTSSNDTASWPTDFRFEEPLFVIDKDGKFVTDSRTDLNDNQNFDFLVGDEIYMPLSAADQIVYTVDGAKGNLPSVAKRTISLKASENNARDTINLYEDAATGNIVVDNFVYLDKDNNVLYFYGYADADAAYVALGYEVDVPLRGIKITNVTVRDRNGKAVTKWENLSRSEVKVDSITVTKTVPEKEPTTKGPNQEIVKDDDGKFLYVLTYNWNKGPLDATDMNAYSTQIEQLKAELGDATTHAIGVERTVGVEFNATVDVVLPAVAATNGSDGKFVPINQNSVNNNNNVTDGGYKKEDGIYTGNIDKNWSINLVEDTHSAGKVTDIVDKAEFYRASTADIAKYPGVFKEKGVYVKVTLKDFFDSVDSADLKYYAYVANNSNSSKTNQVIVSGTYKNNGTKDVSFKWTNNANEPAVWKVKKGENGTAVFDFKDLAFFTVKMYSEEKMYLDLDTTYQKAVAGEWDADFDSFFKFKGTNANFAREGELILASDDANLNVYQINADGDLVPVDAAYVEDYQLVNTNEKINGYVFNTRELGNYVLSADELEATEEETPNEEETLPEPEVETPEANETNPTPSKNNPSTGANDMVGVSVALAVVSVAAAGALALKK